MILELCCDFLPGNISVSIYPSRVGGKSRQKWEFVIGIPAEELSLLICPTSLTHTHKLVGFLLAPGSVTVTSPETDIKPYKNKRGEIFVVKKKRYITTGRPISWQTSVGLTLIWDVPPSCPAAQPVLPLSHQPRQRVERAKSKSTQPMFASGCVTLYFPH